eukprot:5374322-Pyramimonas_sp.AAC.1
MQAPRRQRSARGFQAAAVAEGLHKRGYEPARASRDGPGPRGLGNVAVDGPTSRVSGGESGDTGGLSARDISNGELSRGEVGGSGARAVAKTKTAEEGKCNCAPTSRYVAKCEAPAGYDQQVWQWGGPMNGVYTLVIVILSYGIGYRHGHKAFEKVAAPPSKFLSDARAGTHEEVADSTLTQAAAVAESLTLKYSPAASPTSAKSTDESIPNHHPKYQTLESSSPRVSLASNSDSSIHPHPGSGERVRVRIWVCAREDEAEEERDWEVLQVGSGQVASTTVNQVNVLHAEAKAAPPGEPDSALVDTSGAGGVLPLRALSGAGGLRDMRTLSEQVLNHALEHGNSAEKLKAMEIYVQMHACNLSEHANLLRSEQLDQSKVGNELKGQAVAQGAEKMAAKREEAAAAHARCAAELFRARCRDDLSAGLLLLLGCILWSMWRSTGHKLAALAAQCSEQEQKGGGMLGLVSLWRPAILDSVGRGGCVLGELAATLGGAAGGFAALLFVAFALVRSNVLAHRSAAPLTVLLVVMGGACGAVGAGAISRAGGSGTVWLVLWEALCVVHAYAALTGAGDLLVRVLHGDPRPPLEGKVAAAGLGLGVRSLLFHLALGYVLPVATGTLPFVLGPV